MKNRVNWKSVAKRVGVLLNTEANDLSYIVRDMRQDAPLKTFELLMAHLRVKVNTLQRLSKELREGYEPHL